MPRSIVPIVLALAGLLGGCVGGKTLVHTAPGSTVRFQSIRLIEGPSTVALDEDDLKLLRRELEDNLIDRDAFRNGDELRLTYRVIQHDSGSRVARYFALGLAGAASLTVEAIFTDKDGNVLAAIESDGITRAGLFSGSSDHSIERAAEEISEYAIDHFH